MAERHALAQQIAAATAAGDSGALAALSIELLAALTAAERELETITTADRERKRKQADRTRRSRNATSREVTSQSVVSRDVTLPPPGSSSPEPLITPSSPASSSSSPAADDAVTPEERAFFAEVDSLVLATATQRFLAGKPSTARIAWVGRFRGAMSRPPHPTVAELHDALEDLMANEPPANWVPTLFRTYVGRIRRDAAREAERNAATPSRNGQRAAAASDAPKDAGTMFARIREFVQISDPVPGQPRRRFIRRADVEQLGERVLRAYDEIGGADRFTDPDEKVGFVLRDFTKALGTLNGAHP